MAYHKPFTTRKAYLKFVAERKAYTTKFKRGMRSAFVKQKDAKLPRAPLYTSPYKVLTRGKVALIWWKKGSGVDTYYKGEILDKNGTVFDTVIGKSKEALVAEARDSLRYRNKLEYMIGFVYNL